MIERVSWVTSAIRTYVLLLPSSVEHQAFSSRRAKNNERICWGNAISFFLACNMPWGYLDSGFYLAIKKLLTASVRPSANHRGLHGTKKSIQVETALK